MSDDDGPGPTRAERFGQFVADAARAAGYDIDSPRGGGRVALARATSMGQSSVGRMLAGKSLPSPRFYDALADALRVPLRDILIASGTATADRLTAAAEQAADAGRLTPEEAAARVGITNPANVSLLVSMIENMLQQEDGSAGAA